MAEAQKNLKLNLATMPGSSLWTGGIDQNMTYVKATSILGGLRFWTEALLRSYGKAVCTTERCTHDTNNPQKTCAACSLFGCTGLARSFMMHISNIEMTPNKLDCGKKKLLKEGWQGNFDISLMAQRPINEQGDLLLPEEVLTALGLMIGYGTLGAQDQYGCGLIRFREKNGFQEFLAHTALPGSISSRPDEGAALQDFFFFKGKVRTGKKPLDACFDIRKKIRAEAEKLKNAAFVSWFCGSLYEDQPGKHFFTDDDSNNSGTRYCMGVSGDILYGWGCVNTHLPIEKKKEGRTHNDEEYKTFRAYEALRDPMLDTMKSQLEIELDGLKWKEFASKRDNCTPANVQSDWLIYLTDMLAHAHEWRK